MLIIQDFEAMCAADCLGRNHRRVRLKSRDSTARILLHRT